MVGSSSSLALAWDEKWRFQRTGALDRLVRSPGGSPEFSDRVDLRFPISLFGRGLPKRHQNDEQLLADDVELIFGSRREEFMDRQHKGEE